MSYTVSKVHTSYGTLYAKSKDLIIRRCNSPVDPHENGVSLIQIKRDLNPNALWFDVVATGPEVKDIRVGEKILVKNLDYMTPITIDGVQYTVTDESKVWVVY